MTGAQAAWLRKLICRVFGHKFWEDRWNGAVMADHCLRCAVTPAGLAALAEHETQAAAPERQGKEVG